MEVIFSKVFSWIYFLLMNDIEEPQRATTAKPTWTISSQIFAIDLPTKHPLQQSILQPQQFGDSRNSGFSLYVFTTILLISLTATSTGWLIGVGQDIRPAIFHNRQELSSQIHFTELTWTLSVAILMVGGLIGNLLAKSMADNLGRRNSLALNNLALLAGSILTCTSTTATQYMVGRFLSGVSCGIGILVANLYVSEIWSPTRLRGFYGSLFGAMWMVGLGVSKLSAIHVRSGLDWRLVVSVVPASLSIIQGAWLMMRVESPCYLIKARHTCEARHALLKLRRGCDVNGEWQEWLDSLNQSVDNDSGCELKEEKEETMACSVGQLARGKTRHNLIHLLICSVVLAILQQLTRGLLVATLFGDSSISSEVFSDASFISNQWGTSITYLLGIPSALLCCLLVDKLGRRPLLMGSLGGYLVCSALAAAGMANGPNAMVAASVMMMELVAGVGVGTIAWFYVGETMPAYARATAMTLVYGVGWIVSVVYELLGLVALQPVWVFVGMSAGALAGLVFVAVWVPETMAVPVSMVVGKKGHVVPMEGST